MIRVLVALSVLGTLALPMLAVALVAVGIAGRRDRTSPRCGRCRSAIGFDEIGLERPCPACGAAAREVAPRAAVRRPWWRMLGAGLASAALAIGSFALGRALELRPVPAATTASGVRPALYAGAPYAREVIAIEEAVRDGRISASEVRAEVLAAIAAEVALNAGTQSLQRSPAALRVAALALGDPGADESYWKAVLDACAPTPVPAVGFLETTNPTIHLDPTLEPHPDLPLVRVALVTALTLDGAPIDLDRLRTGLARDPVPPLPLGSLAPGEHLLEVEFETRLYERFDGQRIGLGTARLLPLADWPSPLARSMASARVPFTSPADEPPRDAP